MKPSICAQKVQDFSSICVIKFNSFLNELKIFKMKAITP